MKESRGSFHAPSLRRGSRRQSLFLSLYFSFSRIRISGGAFLRYRLQTGPPKRSFLSDYCNDRGLNREPRGFIVWEVEGFFSARGAHSRSRFNPLRASVFQTIRRFPCGPAEVTDGILVGATGFISPPFPIRFVPSARAEGGGSLSGVKPRWSSLLRVNEIFLSRARSIAAESTLLSSFPSFLFPRVLLQIANAILPTRLASPPQLSMLVYIRCT